MRVIILGDGNCSFGIEIIQEHLDACYEVEQADRDEIALFALEFAVSAGQSESIREVRVQRTLEEEEFRALAFLQNSVLNPCPPKFYRRACSLFCNFHPPTCAREILISVFVFSELIIKKTLKQCKKVNRSLGQGFI